MRFEIQFFICFSILFVFSLETIFAQSENSYQQLLRDAKSTAFSNTYDAEELLSQARGTLSNLTDSLEYLRTKITVLSRSGNADEALQLIYHIDSIVTKHEHPFIEHYLPWSIICVDKGEYTKAIELMLTAINKDKQISEDGLVYMNLGYCYGKINEKTLQEKVLKRGYELTTVSNDNKNQAYAANMLGMFYEDIDSIALAINYYEKGKQYAIKEKRWDKYIDNVLNIARIQMTGGDMEKAKFSLLNAERYFSQCLTPRAPAMGTLMFVKFYMKLNQYTKAEKYFQLALRYSKKVTYVQHQKDLCSTGIKLYSELNNKTKVYEQFEAYKHISQTDRRAKQDNRLISKIGEISFKNNLLQSELNKRKRSEILIGVIILMLFILIQLISYKKWKKIFLNLEIKEKALRIKYKHLVYKYETNQKERIDTQRKLIVSQKKDIIQKDQSLMIIQKLFGIPSDIAKYNLGALQKLVSDTEKQISGNALEFLQITLSNGKTMNFKDDKRLIYYAKRELESLGITNKVIEKYSSFFKLCNNLMNTNYKISEIDLHTKTQYELYYLCTSISNMSLKDLRENLAIPCTFYSEKS